MEDFDPNFVPSDDHPQVVINCGHPDGPKVTETTFGELASVLEAHTAENDAARAKAQAELERVQAERAEAERHAALRATQNLAAQTAALNELRVKAQMNPDLALLARALGLPI